MTIQNYTPQTSEGPPDFISNRSPNLGKCRTNIKTECISKKSCQKLFNAFDYASNIDTPMNYFVVILLKDAIEQCASTAFFKIREKYSYWLRHASNRDNSGNVPTYVYTFENPKDNVHVNWCLHIPPMLQKQFEQKLYEWVEKVQGKGSDETIYFSKINPHAPKAVANYILKGVDEKHASNFYLNDLQSRKGPQGVIYGKRTGFSQSIGVTAQARAEFDPTRYRRKKQWESEYA